MGVLFGQFDPQTTYRDGGRFDSGTVLGVTGTWWGHRLVGLGWKHYRFLRPNSHPEWNMGWTYALGGEFRFGSEGRLGLRAEFRDLRSNFERWGGRTSPSRIVS